MGKMTKYFKIETKYGTTLVKGSWKNLLDIELPTHYSKFGATIYPINIIQFYWSKFLFKIKNNRRTK